MIPQIHKEDEINDEKGVLLSINTKNIISLNFDQQDQSSQISSPDQLEYLKNNTSTMKQSYYFGRQVPTQLSTQNFNLQISPQPVKLILNDALQFNSQNKKDSIDNSQKTQQTGGIQQNTQFQFLEKQQDILKQQQHLMNMSGGFSLGTFNQVNNSTGYGNVQMNQDIQSPISNQKQIQNSNRQQSSITNEGKSKVATASPKKRGFKLHEMLSMNQFSDQNKYTSSTTRPYHNNGSLNQGRSQLNQTQRIDLSNSLYQERHNIDKQSVISFSNMTPFSGLAQPALDTRQFNFTQNFNKFSGGKQFSNQNYSLSNEKQAVSQLALNEVNQDGQFKNQLKLPTAFGDFSRHQAVLDIIQQNSSTSKYQQHHQQQRQQIKSERLKAPQDFVAYIDERDHKGNLLSSTSPIQQMIERIKEQRNRNGNMKWTTEKNLRQTKKNAMNKIQHSLRISSQTTTPNINGHKNISTAENSLEFPSRRSTIKSRLKQQSPDFTRPAKKQNVSDFVQTRENSLEIGASDRSKLLSTTLHTPDLQFGMHNAIQSSQQNQGQSSLTPQMRNELVQQEIKQLDEIIQRNQLFNLEQTQKNKFEKFKLNLVPGQQNTFRLRLQSKQLQEDQTQQLNQTLNTNGQNASVLSTLNKQSPRSLLGLKEVSPIDMARVYMKECKNQQIKYQVKSSEQNDALALRKIPIEDLANQISDDYKAVINLNRGQQVFSAFSPTQRFKKPKFNYNVDNINFSLLDVHDKLFAGKNDQCHFNKQCGRSNIFLTSDQVKIMEEYTQLLQSKLQKLQQFREMVKDNEKKYSISKSWKVTFQYDQHKNVKQLKPFMKEMVSQIRSHTQDAKLSHFDTSYLRSGGIGDMNLNTKSHDQVSGVDPNTPHH
eukprot:403356678